MHCKNCYHVKESTTGQCRICGYEPGVSVDHSVTGDFGYAAPTGPVAVGGWTGEGYAAAENYLAGLVIVFDGPEDGGRPMVLGLTRNHIGSRHDAAVRLVNPSVEPLHGTIFIRGGLGPGESPVATYVDESERGTLVDGVLVRGQEMPLAHGTKLRIGRFVLVYCEVVRPRAFDWS